MQVSRRDAFTLLCLGTAAAATPRLAFARDTAARAREALDALAAQDKFAGAVLVSQNGRPALRHAWGLADREARRPNTVDTRFNIASMGKMFTAVAIAQLVEQGKLGWNDRLSDRLPDFPRETASRVTLDQLLTHRAGFGAYFAAPGWREAQFKVRTVSDYVALFRNEPLRFEPGSQFGYSNSGYALLGAVIEQATGRDYYDHVRQAVFRPAGMTRSGWREPGQAVEGLATGYGNGCAMRPDCEPGPWRPIPSDKGSPAGGGFSTADDIAAFERALRGGKLVKPQTFATLLERRVPMPGPGGPAADYAYGFGRLTVNGKPAWGHNGGSPGAGCQFDTLDDGSLSIIVMTNQDGALRPALSAVRQAFA